jgi:hypothetical protein
VPERHPRSISPRIQQALPATSFVHGLPFITTQHETPRAADQSLFDWSVEQTSKTILVHHLKGMRSDDFDFRAARLIGLGYLKEVPPEGPNIGGFRALVMSNVVHRLASWLNRYGGFPSATDLDSRL